MVNTTIKYGDAIILNNISSDLRHQLESRGFNIIEVTLTEFLKAGGAAKCLVMKLSRPFVEVNNGRAA